MALELINTTLFLDPNLLSYYRMEGNSNDSKGSVNGTDTNITYSLANGQFGQGARSAAGAGNGISFGNNFNFTSSAFTFLFWLYPESFVNSTFIINKGQSSVAGYGLFYTGTSGAVVFRTNQAGAAQDTSTTTTLTLNTYTMVTVTRSGSTVKIYFNGTEVTYAATGTHTNPLTNSNNCYLYRYDSTALDITARTDDVAIFNRALGSGEVSNHFNGFDGQKGGAFLYNMV